MLVFVHFPQVALRRELSFMANATSLAEVAVALLPALALQSLADASEEWDTLRYFLEDAARPSLVAAFALLFLLLIWPQVLSSRAMVTALRAEEPSRVVQAKVAPSGRGDDVFRTAGEWLNTNSPPEATVASNNVGVIGYFADRAMISLSSTPGCMEIPGLRRITELSDGSPATVPSSLEASLWLYSGAFTTLSPYLRRK